MFDRKGVEKKEHEGEILVCEDTEKEFLSK